MEFPVCHSHLKLISTNINLTIHSSFFPFLKVVNIYQGNLLVFEFCDDKLSLQLFWALLEHLYTRHFMEFSFGYLPSCFGSFLLILNAFLWLFSGEFPAIFRVFRKLFRAFLKPPWDIFGDYLRRILRTVFGINWRFSEPFLEHFCVSILSPFVLIWSFFSHFQTSLEIFRSFIRNFLVQFYIKYRVEPIFSSSKYLWKRVLTYSLSSSATQHLYCAVEKRQISANWRTDTLIFFTGLFELFWMCTLTEIISPW